MANEHAPYQRPVLKHIGTRLAVHFQYGRPGDLRVVLRRRKPPRQPPVGVFHVRQPHIHLSLQRLQGLHPFIAAAVVHHGHRRLFLQRGQNVRQKLSGRHQLQILGALRQKFTKDGLQPRRRQGLAPVFRGNLIILAVGAPQSAAGKKHGAAAAVGAEYRLLPVVQGGSGRRQPGAHPAKAQLPCRPVDAAAPGTELAVFISGHTISPFPHSILPMGKNRNRHFSSRPMCGRI